MTRYTFENINEKVHRLRRDVHEKPVYICDRGKPRFVIMTVDEYDVLRGETTDFNEVIEACNQSDQPDAIDVKMRYGGDIDDAIDRALEIIERAPDAPPDPGDELPHSDSVAESRNDDEDGNTER